MSGTGTGTVPSHSAQAGAAEPHPAQAYAAEPGAATKGPAPAGTARARLSPWWALGWLAPLALQLLHTLLVVPYYHVGSFDDDGNYLMAAHVLAAGGGLTSAMPSGARVVAYYLPGYPLLLVPVVWAFGSALWAPRALSALCVALLYPLVWTWLGRKEVRPAVRTGVLVVLALNPVLATYSSMVMAEAPFLAVFMLALLALGTWERLLAAGDRRAGAAWAAVLSVLLAYLIWLKEAGVGFAIGLVLYLLWRRWWRPALGVAAGVGVLMVPGLVARLVVGGSALGNRYAGEISSAGRGGFVHQVISEVAGNIWTYLQSTLRQSVTPVGSPLPNHGPVFDLLALAGGTVPLFIAVGAVAWYRRHPRAETWMLAVYFAETLAYPYINQRRVILALPVVITWYTVGAVATGRWAWHRARRALTHRAAVLGTAVPVVATAAVLLAAVPTASAFDRNYMYRQGVQSSEFAGTPSMTLLKAVGVPSEVVETDYRGSVGYFTGHRTAWYAFTSTTDYGPLPGRGRCAVAAVNRYFHDDDADFLFLGDVNVPGLLDSPCLMSLVSRRPTAQRLGAVRLLSSNIDHESVFEMVGPGSTQPGLVDPTAFASPAGASHVTLAPNGQGDAGGTAYLVASRGGRARFDWRWAKAVKVSQVTVGSVTSTAPITAVSVWLRTKGPTGAHWEEVATADGAVGDAGKAPYLLANLRAGLVAEGLRVTVTTSGTAQVAYANAIGTPVTVTRPAGAGTPTKSSA